MKRKITLLLVLVYVLCMLVGCKPTGQKVTLDDLKDFAENAQEGETSGGGAAVDVTVYLVPGRGHTVGGVAGKTVASLCLENAYEHTAKPGAALPTADAAEKLTFVGWAMPQDAMANPIMTVPKKNGAILYGMWTLDGSGGDKGETPDGNPDETPSGANADFYLAFDGGAADETTRFTINDSPLVPGSKEFFLTRAFTVGEKFAFVSKNAMDGITKGDEKVYPTSNNCGFTLNWDNDKGIKTSDYFMPTAIKQQGENPDSVWANVTKSELKCIATGTYTLYVTVYDNGWVAVFAQPA